MDTKKLRVSDVIPQSDIKKWEAGDVITISAGTGRGKSYFIKNVLYQYAKADNKKILMLIHRANCVNQFRKEIERDKKTDVIFIQTYQKLETDIINGKPLDLSQFKYLVCDEFHYFISDAGFNNHTDISFATILNVHTAIRIFMSATGTDMKCYLNNYEKISTIDYSIPLDFTFIKELTFFHKDKSIEEFLWEAISKGDKAIFFIQSAKKAYSLYRKFEKYALFNCSKSHKLYKAVDTREINSMLENEKFDKQILITTSCFDAGINIHDKFVKHIVIDIADVNSLIQCIGRKRIDYSDPDDKINLYIKVINNQQLGGMETRTKQLVEMADYLRENGAAALVEKYPRQNDTSGIIYDVRASSTDGDTCTKQINQLMYLKKKLDIADIQSMKLLGEFGYCKKLAQLFGFVGHRSYRIIDEDYSLERYLSNNVDKVMLQQKDRKELITKIDVRSDGKQLKGINALNSALAERGLPYQIKEIDTTTIINGQRKRFKHAWTIVWVGYSDVA